MLILYFLQKLKSNYFFFNQIYFKGTPSAFDFEEIPFKIADYLKGNNEIQLKVKNKDDEEIICVQFVLSLIS